MLLKVGELAARTNQTVRTLHHYDAVGLLTPSARSDAGYRLYDQHDVARLQAIQAMRHLGLTLAEIGAMLAGTGHKLPEIIARQICSIDHEVKQALYLREQLALLQDCFANGGAPVANDWLATLTRMTTYGKYFTASDLKRILASQVLLEPEWSQLFADVRVAMDQGISADSPNIQPLAQRWLSLMFDWMDGDFEMMSRWGQMYRAEPEAYAQQNPSPAMVTYITTAIDLRKAAFLRHMSLDELKQVRPLSVDDWGLLAQDIERLQQRYESPSSLAAKAVVERWAMMALEQVGHQRHVLEKMLTAIRSEPLLQVTDSQQAVVRDFLRQAIRTHGDPFSAAPNTA